MTLLAGHGTPQTAAQNVLSWKPLPETVTDLLHHASGSGPFPIGCDFENGVVTRFLST
jgi:hypothetical protein